MAQKHRTLLSLAVIFLCLPAIFYASGHLPPNRRALIEKKYAGWSGVLRIWVPENVGGAEILSKWLRRQGDLFEKRHRGAFVQVTAVPEAALSGESGIRPPEMVLFLSGQLKNAEDFCKFGDLPVRAALRDCGGGRAAPVALDGYAWIVSDENAPAAVPDDEPCRRWSRAARAMGGRRTEIDVHFDGSEAGGLDIGAGTEAADLSKGGAGILMTEAADLSKGGAEIGKNKTGGDAGALMEETAGRASDFSSLGEADFLAGRAGRLLAGGQDLRRMIRLREKNRGPQWSLMGGEGAFSDQVFFLAVREGEAAETAREFLDWLLGAEAQRDLCRFCFFGVRDGATGYSVDSEFERFDALLHREDLTVLPAFPVGRG